MLRVREKLELQHDKTNKMKCVQRRLRSARPSAQSDQSIRCPHEEPWVLGSLATRWAHSEYSDQTGWMPRLIWLFSGHTSHFVGFGERGGSVVECRTPEREVGGSKPTAAVLCPWVRHFTPRKYWLITQEAVAPSRHDWKIVDWDVKPQHKQTILLVLSYSGSNDIQVWFVLKAWFVVSISSWLEKNEHTDNKKHSDYESLINNE